MNSSFTQPAGGAPGQQTLEAFLTNNPNVTVTFEDDGETLVIRIRRAEFNVGTVTPTSS